MKRFVCLAMLCTAVLTPRTATAQEEDAAERATSLSLTPVGSTNIGLWHRLSPGVELGLEVGALAVDTEGEDDLGPGDTRSGYTVAPSIKLFGGASGALQPYAIGGVFFTAREQEFDGFEDQATLLGVTLGAGLEWSPVARVRIGGHAGVRAARVDGESTTFELGEPVQYDVSGWEANTFTSGLTFYYSF